MHLLFEIVQNLPTAALMLALWMAGGLPVMKLSAREAPLGRLAWIALKSFGSVLLILTLLSVIWTVLLHRSFGSPPFIAIAIAFVTGGWLMNRWLKRAGIERPFPGIGARAMLAAFLMTVAWLAYVIWTFDTTTS
ncbi:MAG: hypothetical protein ABI963_13000 [Rhizomicrobium sp.]